MKVGDWANSYSKGIFRIEKFVDRYYDESSALGTNKIGDKYNSRIVVLKRFLNSKYKKSISYDSCDEAYLSPLNNEQLQNLSQVIKDNPKILTEFDNYQIPPITSVYNSNLQIDNDNDLKTVEELISFIKNGKSFIEIENEMQRIDILLLKARMEPSHWGNYGFQLYNYDIEYVNKRLIWRDARLYKK